MAYDYSKLRGRIIERYGTIGEFSKQMPNCTASVNAKLNNKSAWKQEEIQNACRLLGIQPEQIGAYFFTPTVEKTKHSGRAEQW